MEMNRRGFLGASAASAAAAFAADEKMFDGGLSEVLPPGVPARARPLVPAGSDSLAAFSLKCVGCQLCVSACPHGVLRPSMDLKRLGQPEMGFERGWCRPACSACGNVCPAGAIRPVAPKERFGTHIGRAVWSRGLCLAVQDGVACSACQYHCPTKAISLVPIDPSDKNGPKAPVVDEDLCIGCGACEHFCPARPIPAMTLEGYAVHRVVHPMPNVSAGKAPAKETSR
jgi:ferredoxin